MRVPNEVIIRMYDVGFGDSFFLRFPTRDRKRYLKVLIDCGTFAKGTNELKDVVNSIISTAAEEDGIPRLDVVVATHRHKDHVGGFKSGAWDQVDVKEVWMPWTEEPDDDDARRLRLAHATVASRLAVGLEQLAAHADPAASIAGLALANESSMQTLWNGFSGNPVRRHLPPKNKRLPYALRSPALPGVAISVLGPSRDEDVIRNLEPPDAQSYLWASGLSAEHVSEPFAAEFAAYTPTQFGRREETRHLALPNKVRVAAETADRTVDPLAVAAQLDSVINGTSLVLVFEIGKAIMLFPGDAQWGTWEMILNNPDCRQLVEGATFYKVSHHASHNGTPVEFVEHVMKRGARAMVSVRPFSSWPDIPRKPLLTELVERTANHVVRSDRAAKPAKDNWYTVAKDEYATFIEARIKC